MPIGAQQRQYWTPTTYPSMTSSTLKGAIDINSGIAANTAGALYVYPNNPVAMNVLVDPGFNLPQVGASTPELLNGAATPVTVSLTAPGSNSYYACVYWDLSTSSAGVIYGATAVSPIPIYPDQYWRIPLAFVLLTTGQATVVASNIYDARTWIPPQPLAVITAVQSNGITLPCTGASAVNHSFSFNAGSIWSYSALSIGIPVTITAQNVTASGLTLKFAATTPAGTAYTVQSKPAGASATSWTNLTTTGILIPANGIVILSGVTLPGPTLDLVNG